MRIITRSFGRWQSFKTHFWNKSTKSIIKNNKTNQLKSAAIDDSSLDKCWSMGFWFFLAAQTKKHKVELFRIDTLRSNNGASVSNTRSPFFADEDLRNFQKSLHWVKDALATIVNILYRVINTYAKTGTWRALTSIPRFIKILYSYVHENEQFPVWRGKLLISIKI